MTNADMAGYLHDTGQPTDRFQVLKYADTDF